MNPIPQGESTNDPPRGAAGTTGPHSLVMHSAARYYDLLASVLTLGRERALRERLVELAALKSGETVLDVGCGTGSLALAAKRRVGPLGRVRGVDASPEMIAVARAKAMRARLELDLDVARAEALPLPDASVDAVLSSLMLHHLPAPVRESFAREIRRVLKPGGRVLAVDFERPANRRAGLVARIHRHGGVPLAGVVDLLRHAGLHVSDCGSVGVSDLQFTLAVAPSVDGQGSSPMPAAVRALAPLPFPRWLLPGALVGVVGIAHLLTLSAALRMFALGTLAGLAFIALVAASHLALGGGVYRLARRHRRPRR